MNFLQQEVNLVPLLQFASVQAGPNNQAIHTGTYTCEPVPRHLRVADPRYRL